MCLWGCDFFVRLSPWDFQHCLIAQLFHYLKLKDWKRLYQMSFWSQASKTDLWQYLIATVSSRRNTVRNTIAYCSKKTSVLLRSLSSGELNALTPIGYSISWFSHPSRLALLWKTGSGHDQCNKTKRPESCFICKANHYHFSSSVWGFNQAPWQFFFFLPQNWWLYNIV